MCSVCGCGEGETRIDGVTPHAHQGHDHGHPTIPWTLRPQGDGEVDLDYGQGPAHAHAPGMSQSRMVQIEQDVLAKNDAYAAENRTWLAERGILALNLVSSPGSGKTTLLTRTIRELAGAWEVGVIEGDQQTDNDAARIRETGARSIQINTGKGCHLDGHMVGHALQRLELDGPGVLFIENVGNLVCPSSFDLGESARVVVLSVTEGEDKPLKYPDMFHRADLMLLNKIDLLPHLDFDRQQCLDYARQINPGIEVLEVSATTGEGMETWRSWLEEHRRQQLEAAAGSLEERAEHLRAALDGLIRNRGQRDLA